MTLYLLGELYRLERLPIYIALYLALPLAKHSNAPHEVAIPVALTLILVSLDKTVDVRREAAEILFGLPITREEYAFSEYLAILTSLAPLYLSMVMLWSIDPVEPLLALSTTTLLSLYMAYSGPTTRGRILAIVTVSLFIEFGGVSIGIPMYLLPSHIVTGIADLYGDWLWPNLTLIGYHLVIWILLMRSVSLWDIL